jgi:transposase
MKGKCRKFSPEFKAQVALSAIREQETLSELSARYEVSVVMISRWKKEFLENASNAFGGVKDAKPEVETEKLYAQIGELTMQVNFLKKSLKRTGL